MADKRRQNGQTDSTAAIVYVAGSVLSTVVSAFMFVTVMKKPSLFAVTLLIMSLCALGTFVLGFAYDSKKRS